MQGVTSSATLESDSQIVLVLMDVYSIVGDQIALQYGGSEAHKKVKEQASEVAGNAAARDGGVAGGGRIGDHRLAAGIKGSVKAAGGGGKHKELLTSIRRYYSNAFTDRLKQDAMNVFLGHYIVSDHDMPLWELENDYYLHNFHVQNGVELTMKHMQEPWERDNAGGQGGGNISDSNAQAKPLTATSHLDDNDENDTNHKIDEDDDESDDSIVFPEPTKDSAGASCAPAMVGGAGSLLSPPPSLPVIRGNSGSGGEETLALPLRPVMRPPIPPSVAVVVATTGDCIPTATIALPSSFSSYSSSSPSTSSSSGSGTASNAQSMATPAVALMARRTSVLGELNVRRRWRKRKQMVVRARCVAQQVSARRWWQEAIHRYSQQRMWMHLGPPSSG